MTGIRPSGEAVDMPGPAGRPRGRSLDAAECRRLNDMLFAALARRYSAPDAHAILAMRRTLKQRYRRKQEMGTHAPELRELFDAR